MSSVRYIDVFSRIEHTLVGQNHRRAFLENFHQVQNIYSYVKTLPLEWTAERASECDEIEDFCSKNGESDLARMYYQNAVTLNIFRVMISNIDH